ncbi:MAG: hypothetical protein IFK94_01225 [Acidobacteria bacterium]|uniref:Uncharacterized protein n=1 Tax=Candidatus Polarisedimenticola svalbardensis TaxID=2886004 RepID=A0A8J7C223_9BACT|nr:hypothetical protein [Candidatus Polarisedimenticola svalbardensis]
MDRTGRQYVRKLEDALARRAEGPRVFTQRDYRLATRWHQEGVPIGLILETLDRRKVAARSLAQIASRVDESWKAVCAGKLRADETEPPASVADRGPERELADALLQAPPSTGLHALLLRLQEAYRGDASPADLEKLIEEQLPGAVLPEQLQEAEELARLSLESHRGRMPPDVFRETMRRGVLARLRRVTGIPRFRRGSGHGGSAAVD